MSPTPLTAEEQLREYLTVLTTGCAPGQFVDVRWRTPAGPMRRRFLPALDVAQIALLAGRIAPRNDVYVGVAVRDGNAHGGRAAVGGCRLVWVESDDLSTAERLLAFAHPPTMAVASGTPGHLQLYWLLDRRCTTDQLELANRRLALALAGDLACADASRILRLPGTFNHKHEQRRAVRLLATRPGAAYSLAQLTYGLPSYPATPERMPARAKGRAGRSTLDRQLLAIPAAEYALALTGRAANREGKLLCPFHEDTDPSLQLYADGGFFCFGSGCRRGGTIFDFAGHLWGIAPRRVGFLELRVRLAREFGLRAESDRGFSTHSAAGSAALAGSAPGGAR